MNRLLIGLCLWIGYGLIEHPAWSKTPTRAQESGVQESSDLIVVLKDPPVLVYQKELAGGKSIHSPQFKNFAVQAQEYANEIYAKQQNVERAILQLDANATVYRRISHVLNALVIRADSSILSRLNAIAGVKYYAPVTTVYPSLTQSHSLMNVFPAWERVEGVSKAGEGVFIGVIDTGIDISHPAFDGTGYTPPPGFPKGETAFTNNKVIASRMFPSFRIPQQNRTPEDQDGHGSHVASSAAANPVASPLGTLSGVAPRAFMGNYKIFFNGGGAGSGEVIAAIDQAVRDGAHILNMSFGSDLISDPQHDPQIEAVQNAIDMGVTCVIAAGNRNRLFTIGNPQQVKDAIAVAASTNTHNLNTGSSAVLVTALTEDGGVLFQDAAGNLSSGRDLFTKPFYTDFQIQSIAQLAGSEFDPQLCIDLPEQVTVDDWLLVERGICAFVDKVIRAEAAGANGVIFYDNEDPLTAIPAVDGSHIPSLLIERRFGQLIEDAVAAGNNVTVQVRNETRAITPNQAATFNSMGPSVNYTLKPDLSAVGTGSFAASQNDFDAIGNRINPTLSAFGWLSGTSMAAPRISGSAALVKQKHPDWDPARIKAALVLSATRILQNPSNPNLSSLTVTGAGLADADAALTIQTLAVPPMVGFGAQTVLEETSVTEWIEVINASDQAALYLISQPDTEGQPLMVPSVSQFILQPDESIHIALTAQYSPALPAKDYEVLLRIENLTTGETLPLWTWTRVSKEAEPMGDILMIDDDEGRNFEAFYGNLLTARDIAFTRWDANVRGNNYPNLSYLKRFKTVLWFMGEKSLNTIPDETSNEYIDVFNRRHLFETQLTRYLAAGGSLFLSGQDFLDDKETAMISREVLHTFMNDTPSTIPPIDRDAGAQTLMGVEGNPISDGLGPLDLVFPDDFTDLTDRVFSDLPSVTRPLFSSNGDENRFVATTVDACSYRAVFLAFPLEALDEADAGVLLTRSLDWLDEKTDFSEPALLSVTPNEILLSENSAPLSIEINGRGFALTSGYRAYFNQTALLEETQRSCSLLTAEIPAEMEAGLYTLRVVTGAGDELFLPNALRILRNPPVSVNDWEMLQ